MSFFYQTTRKGNATALEYFQKAVGADPNYGTAYEFFGKGDAGHDACEALYSLGAVGSIDTMIANFLTSLQSLADEQSRVHGSVNLNTETGRLSSRRPNLQNQPALEKDKYQIRKAFQSSPGNSLIVADYGQLELRLLASMTNCQSMITAFAAGGDFHSRTALDMFDHVQVVVIMISPYEVNWSVIIMIVDPDYHQRGQEGISCPIMKYLFTIYLRLIIPKP